MHTEKEVSVLALDEIFEESVVLMKSFSIKTSFIQQEVCSRQEGRERWNFKGNSSFSSELPQFIFDARGDFEIFRPF